MLTSMPEGCVLEREFLWSEAHRLTDGMRSGQHDAIDPLDALKSFLNGLRPSPARFSQQLQAANEEQSQTLAVMGSE